ncbi:hypothetical protein FQN50_003039 [Emmonsiellopsis sp. PD_5]|nr:hypothetical protein FQN50_003039 [Emmonsiellopsis sp. PD_5]
MDSQSMSPPGGKTIDSGSEPVIDDKLEPFIAKSGPCIETERLFMRPLVEDDVGDIFAIRSRAEVMKWSFSGKPDANLAATRKNFLNFNPADVLALAICEASNTTRAIGSVAFFGGKGGNFELGYIMHPEFWGKGYASEAVSAAIDAWWEFIAAFPRIGIDGNGSSNEVVLHAVTDKNNFPSNRVLEKCGFDNVGDLPAHDDDGRPAFMWELRKKAKTVDLPK